MELFLMLTFLFFVGSVSGWIIELIFRRFILRDKLVINPGFLVGPYLPIYGFGLCIFFLLSQIPLNGILVIFIMAATVTLIEYIAGLIFIKKMGIMLWDYSNSWGNIDGIICPLYSFFWLVAAAIYYYFINPYIMTSLNWLHNNLAFSFFIGMFFGIIIIDFVYSTNLVVKIKKLAKDMNLVVKYDELKIAIAEEIKKRKEKYSFLFAVNPQFEKLEQSLTQYAKKQAKNAKKLTKSVNLFIKTKLTRKEKKGS